MLRSKSGRRAVAVLGAVGVGGGLYWLLRKPRGLIPETEPGLTDSAGKIRTGRCVQVPGATTGYNSQSECEASQVCVADQYFAPNVDTCDVSDAKTAYVNTKYLDPSGKYLMNRVGIETCMLNRPSIAGRGWYTLQALNPNAPTYNNKIQSELYVADARAYPMWLDIKSTSTNVTYFRYIAATDPSKGGAIAVSVIASPYTVGQQPTEIFSGFLRRTPDGYCTISPGDNPLQGSIWGWHILGQTIPTPTVFNNSDCDWKAGQQTCPTNVVKVAHNGFFWRNDTDSKVESKTYYLTVQYATGTNRVALRADLPNPTQDSTDFLLVPSSREVARWQCQTV